MTVVILGCGYTGRRVVQRMLRRGVRVIGTSRNPEQSANEAGAEVVRFDILSADALDFVPEDSHIVYSIPPVDETRDSNLIYGAFPARKPRRLIYLSTTGVYGDTRDVDDRTAPAPRHERDFERLKAESATRSGPWSSLVLRPAAIYGPGRGIHQSMIEGRFRLTGNGENFVSRIHVEDLATHVEAAIFSDVTGEWPVADERPCTSREIAEYCSQLLQVPMPGSLPSEAVHHTRRADRRVDGSGIRHALGIALAYPTYEQGIPASLQGN